MKSITLPCYYLTIICNPNLELGPRGVGGCPPIAKYHVNVFEHYPPVTIGNPQAYVCVSFGNERSLDWARQVPDHTLLAPVRDPNLSNLASSTIDQH